MSTAVANEQQVVERLRVAAAWRLAGLLLRRPTPAVREEIAALSCGVGESPLAAALAAAAHATEGEYHGWLGAGGPVSPREVSYRPLEDPGKLLAEIAAFHEAFAYRANAEEPADHVAVAVDFLGFLTMKEAFAVALGRSEDAGVTSAAAERFRERHLVPMARGMLRRFERFESPDGYLACTARAVLVLAGVDPEDATTDAALDGSPFLRPGLDDDTFECGSECLRDAGDCAGRRPEP